MHAKVFNIAPGVPFLPTFVASLLDGRVVEGFSRVIAPLDMARATIYVPTRRAAHALADIFVEALRQPAALLPRILPLGALETTETNLLLEEPGLDRGLEALPRAATEIERRLQLAEMIVHWGRALRHAIISVNAQGRPIVDEGEACLVATSCVDAWNLAGDLAGLIDELIIEDVAWSKLDLLVLPEFDQYWRITVAFLDIAVTQWPQILASRGLVDRARRQVELIERQSARILDGATGGPVIAIGSTGTNKATARLLAAIAHAPRGAVVLPGLDQHLDDDAFASIGGADDTSHGHPQAALARLLPILRIARRDVVALGHAPSSLAIRGRFVAEAMRPAETTDLWRLYRAGLDHDGRRTVLAGVGLIEAADEREEALALAIAMREALETPGATAALITPDRDLAQRVQAELLRWGVEADDSAGEPLSASPHGRLARLIAACVASDLAGEHLTAVLAHPRTRLGLSRAAIDHLAPLVEIGVLRGTPLSLRGGAAAVIAAARALAKDKSAHPAQRRISDADWRQLEDLVGRVCAIFAPLLALHGDQDLTAWVENHRTCLAAVTRDDKGIDGDGPDRDALDDLFDALAKNATATMRFDAEAYGLFFARVAGEIGLPEQRRARSRLTIYGLLEARLIDADVMLLGGLDETVWPPQAETDAFLNRPMRASLGLTPPERKIGQTAHDFTQAMGCRRVILSRALKRGGAPTVASRFIQRLAALAEDAWTGVRARGEVYVGLARGLDRPAAPPAPVGRPLPKPPLSLRPTRLSVTRIEALRRDPYAVYAERCLQLVEMPPLDHDTLPRDIGTAMHAVLERFTRDNPTGRLRPGAALDLEAMLRASLAGQLGDPDFAAFQWPRLVGAIDFYLGFESRRRAAIVGIDVERSGTLEIALPDGSIFTLSATADRIEHHQDGSVTLVDYKTGTPPGKREIIVGFAPQLTLEAAMARRGAFGLPPNTSVAGAVYVKLGGLSGGKETPLAFEQEGTTFAAVVERHYAGLLALLTQFRNAETPYPARPFLKFAARYNLYDHLERCKEWSTEESDA